MCPELDPRLTDFPWLYTLPLGSLIYSYDSTFNLDTEDSQIYVSISEISQL